MRVQAVPPARKFSRAVWNSLFLTLPAAERPARTNPPCQTEVAEQASTECVILEIELNLLNPLLLSSKLPLEICYLGHSRTCFNFGSRPSCAGLITLFLQLNNLERSTRSVDASSHMPSENDRFPQRLDHCGQRHLNLFISFI